jgi:hypothetical protein
MERLAQEGVGLQEEGYHKHILETEKGGIIVIAKGPRFHWKTFLFFEDYGPSFAFAAMPHLRSYTLFEKVPCGI